MPQLHLYVSDSVAEKLRQQAKAKSMSLSKYLAEIVQRETETGWPEDYFEEVIGSWEGEFPDVAELPYEKRDTLG